MAVLYFSIFVSSATRLSDEAFSDSMITFAAFSKTLEDRACHVIGNCDDSAMQKWNDVCAQKK